MVPWCHMSPHPQLPLTLCPPQRPENGVLFIISCWQLIITCLVFNVGRQSFRQPIWTNYWLLASMLALSGFNL
jgi:hypothetical protein